MNAGRPDSGGAPVPVWVSRRRFAFSYEPRWAPGGAWMGTGDGDDLTQTTEHI